MMQFRQLVCVFQRGSSPSLLQLVPWLLQRWPGLLFSAAASVWVWKGICEGVHAGFIIRGGCGAPDVTRRNSCLLHGSSFFSLSFFPPFFWRVAQENFVSIYHRNVKPVNILWEKSFWRYGDNWMISYQLEGAESLTHAEQGMIRFNCLFCMI